MKTREELDRIEAAPYRQYAPKVYDYLEANGFSFENCAYSTTGVKVLDENLELFVMIYGESIHVGFYDRTRRYVQGWSKEAQRSDQRVFAKDFVMDYTEEDVINYIQNPVMPKKYKFTYTAEEERYLVRTPILYAEDRCYGLSDLSTLEFHYDVGEV